MTKRIKIILVSFLCLVLLVSVFSSGVQARPKDGNSTNTEFEFSKISNKSISIESLHDFEEMLLRNGINIVSVKATTSNSIEYNTKFADSIGTIEVETADDEQLSFTIIEDGKQNQLIINDAGEVFIDGMRITVENCEIQNTVTMDSVYYYSTPPVYSASYYVYNSGKTANHNFQLAKNIMNYSAQALVLALDALLPGIGSSIGDLTITYLIVAANSTFGDVLKASGPIYYHSVKKQFMVTNSQGCQKEKLYFYGENGARLSNEYSFVYKYLTQNGA